eukprot:2253926-Karenia_brevis.AAC.1
MVNILLQRKSLNPPRMRTEIPSNSFKSHHPTAGWLVHSLANRFDENCKAGTSTAKYEHLNVQL